MDYFWSHEYRHEMRDLKPYLQKEVHDAFLEFDLELDGVSDLHHELICTVVGDYTIQGEHENERLNRLKNSYETS